MKPNLKWLLLVPLLLLSCTDHSPPPHRESPFITVSIPPQDYFVRQISRDTLSVMTMIPPGYNPATYEPTPGQMKKLHHTRIYFQMGHLPFESSFMKNLKRINPHMKVVDCSEGVSLIRRNSQTVNGFSPVNSGHDEKSPRGVDPHIWLSPRSVKIIARNIRNALVDLDPVNHDFYHTNFQTFLQDIDHLDSEIRTVLSDLKHNKFMVFHPAWSYFARDYGLTQMAIETDGKHPGMSTLRQIIDSARRENIRTIFVQKQFDTHSARTIAREINGQVITLDPLSQNWRENMRHIALSLKKSLK